MKRCILQEFNDARVNGWVSSMMDHAMHSQNTHLSSTWCFQSSALNTISHYNRSPSLLPHFRHQTAPNPCTILGPGACSSKSKDFKRSQRSLAPLKRYCSGSGSPQVVRFLLQRFVGQTSARSRVTGLLLQPDLNVSIAEMMQLLPRYISPTKCRPQRICFHGLWTEPLRIWTGGAARCYATLKPEQEVLKASQSNRAACLKLSLHPTVI